MSKVEGRGPIAPSPLCLRVTFFYFMPSRVNKLRGFDDTRFMFVESKSELNPNPSRSNKSLISGFFVLLPRFHVLAKWLPFKGNRKRSCQGSFYTMLVVI